MADDKTIAPAPEGRGVVARFERRWARRPVTWGTMLWFLANLFDVLVDSYVHSPTGDPSTLIWQAPIAVWTLGAFLWPERGVAMMRRLGDRLAVPVTIGALVAGTALALYDFPEIAPGRLAIEVVEVYGPTPPPTYMQIARIMADSGSSLSIGLGSSEPSMIVYMVSLENVGDVPIGLDSVSVRIEPSGMGEAFLDCPAPSPGTFAILHGDSIAVFVGLSHSVTNLPVDYRFQPDSTVQLLIPCTVPDPNLIPGMTAQHTRHAIRGFYPPDETANAALFWESRNDEAPAISRLLEIADSVRPIR